MAGAMRAKRSPFNFQPFAGDHHLTRAAAFGKITLGLFEAGINRLVV